MTLLVMLLYFTHYFSQPRLGQTKQGVIPRWLSYSCYYILHTTLLSHVWDKQNRVLYLDDSLTHYFSKPYSGKQNRVLYLDDSITHVTIF